MTATDTAETMRHLEETADAAMVGWAKAATEVERLTAERNRLRRDVVDARDELATMKADRDAKHSDAAEAMVELVGSQLRAEDAERERDEARAELERFKEPPSVELPNDRDGVVKAWFRTYLQWRYQAGRADKAEAALARVREYVGGELTFTNAEMSALADCCDDHYEECAAVWRDYFTRVVSAALDGSGT